MIDQAFIDVTKIFGRIELRSWFVYDPVRRRFIGMGSKTVFDGEGRMVEHKVEPTGVEAVYE